MAAQSGKPSGGAERSAWYTYVGHHPFAPGWTLHLESTYRREGLINRWEQFGFRTGAGYELSQTASTQLTYAYFRDYPFEGGSLGKPTTTGPQPEHRIAEDFKLNTPVKHRGNTIFTITQRVRMEQRFRGIASVGQGTTAWNFAQRARYRLTGNIPLHWSAAVPLPNFASAYSEVFANFGSHPGSNALNQSRNYGGFGWNLGNYTSLETGYMFQYMPVGNGYVGEHNHTLQITINCTAPLLKLLRIH